MDADVARYLDDLVLAAREVLGVRLTGAYAAGSVGLDAYRPGRSDVDVALTCAAPLDRTVKRELVTALRHEALPCPARGLELVVYTQESARSGTSTPGFEVELNTAALPRTGARPGRSSDALWRRSAPRTDRSPAGGAHVDYSGRGPSRSHRLPARSLKTTTVPYSSCRGVPTISAP